MAHIELSRAADAILIAPASADFLAKLANGIANDLLSTLVMARRPTCPLLVAPAMNREMWENPATQRNIAQLIADGVTVLGPDQGDHACGETGMGRMLELEWPELHKRNGVTRVSLDSWQYDSNVMAAVRVIGSFD